MDRDGLIQHLSKYASPYPEEEHHVPAFLELLTHPRAYYRDHLPGHITGSAWIVNKDFSSVLLVLHAKLGRWLQPGGHADGDENVLNVARREAEEETGLASLKLLTPSYFDIDIHAIPARPDFPEHFHYDVRFLFQASEKDSVAVSEESRDVKWFPLAEVGEVTGGAESIRRMVGKTGKL